MNGEHYFHDYFEMVAERLNDIDPESLEQAATMVRRAHGSGNKVILAGNGGSAATASHFANDVAIGSDDYDRPFRALSLTDNVAVLTALGNDFGFDEVFVRQLRVLAESGDVLVAISASGNSANLISAVEYAASAGIRTVAITAFDGGRLRSLADLGVHVPTEFGEYGPAEDAHMVLEHLTGAYLMRLVRSER